LLARKLQEQQELRLEQQQELQQRVLGQQRERELEQQQELLLFYHKQPGQQQRSQLPKREICSFLSSKVS
jgi:hypothetical protein